MFDRDYWWRDTALEALHTMGRRFRITYSSQSVTGVAAVIEAGIGVGLMDESSKTANLQKLGADSGFKEMPVSNLVLGRRMGADSLQIRAAEPAIRRAFD